MKLFAAFVLVAFACEPAMAVNKCTQADGKIAYQDAPCNSASRASELRLAPPPQDPALSWRFSREKDAMTGAETCFAVSPEIIMNASFGMHTYANVSVQLAVLPNFGGMALTVRSRPGEAAGIFHHDISGLGVKVDDGQFVPIDERIASNALGFATGAVPDLLGAMQRGKNIRLRLRFWPYDKLDDSRPIALDGFHQAARLALSCASR